MFVYRLVGLGFRSGEWFEAGFAFTGVDLDRSDGDLVAFGVGDERWGGVEAFLDYERRREGRVGCLRY